MASRDHHLAIVTAHIERGDTIDVGASALRGRIAARCRIAARSRRDRDVITGGEHQRVLGLNLAAEVVDVLRGIQFHATAGDAATEVVDISGVQGRELPSGDGAAIGQITCERQLHLITPQQGAIG